jgi:hypothetical protein
MQQTIFYSWQSDSPAQLNRNLIENALKRAVKAIRKGSAPFLEPVIDRDTAGLTGSPGIAESIFAKIAMADVFVADVSIVNPRARSRPSPNPNVLIELGYAVANLGWERILLVQNTAYGPPEKLPFDLRGRRIVQYGLPSDGDGKVEQRGLLQGRLETALRAALDQSSASRIFAGAEVPLWFGTWQIDGRGGMHGGTLRINEVGPSGFLYELMIYSGSHTGEASGFARLVSPDAAYAMLNGPSDDEPCHISFKRSNEGGQRKIRVDESGGCTWYHGMGAPFYGVFIREHDWLFDAGILDELDLMRLKRLVGKFYEPIRSCFQGISQVDNLDQIQGTAASGGVRGLYTIMEGILLRGDDGNLWVAFIDDDVVRYFTTAPNYHTKLPATFEHWRERFAEKTVLYDSDITSPTPDDR